MADSDSLDDILGSSVDATAKAGNKTGTAQPASGTDSTSSGMFSVSGSVNFDSTETQTIDSEAASELLGSEVGSDFGAGINPGAPGTVPGAMPSAQSGAPGAAPQTYGQTPGGQPGAQPGVGGQPPYGAGQPPYGNPGAAPQQNVYVMPTYNQMHVVGDKNKIVAGILGILLGGLGIHNFYLRNYTKAVVQLLLCTIGWIILIGPWIACTWGFIEGILILVSKPGSTWHRDGEGAELID